MKSKKYIEPQSIYDLIEKKHGETLKILYPQFNVRALSMTNDEQRKTLERLAIVDKIEDVLGPSTESSFEAIRFREELKTRKYSTSYPQSSGVGLRTSKDPRFRRGIYSSKY